MCFVSSECVVVLVSRFDVAPFYYWARFSFRQNGEAVKGGFRPEGGVRSRGWLQPEGEHTCTHTCIYICMCMVKVYGAQIKHFVIVRISYDYFEK